MNSWNGKPYHSLDFHLKEMFGRKVYKLALDGGMTCPNRDGSVGRGGCIFCSQGGSGDFAAQKQLSLREQADLAKKLVEKKAGPDALYIAYFQSYTNTYAPLPYLEALFTEAVSLPEVCALSIGTRPDCLPDETVALLSRLNQEKPVWVELGLQTIHESTARFIRRGYGLPVFEDAFRRLRAAGLTVIVHVILGLPGETREDMLENIRYLAGLKIDGIKLQLLHVLKGTDLGTAVPPGCLPGPGAFPVSGAGGGLFKAPASGNGDPPAHRRRAQIPADGPLMERKQTSGAEFHGQVSERK